MDKCGAYLQYKRVTKDPAMPKNILERRRRCLDVMHQGSPFVSPQTSDDEDGVDERGEAERAVVKALMGMGQGVANSNYLIDGDDDDDEEEEV